MPMRLNYEFIPLSYSLFDSVTPYNTVKVTPLVSVTNYLAEKFKYKLLYQGHLLHEQYNTTKY